MLQQQRPQVTRQRNLDVADLVSPMFITELIRGGKRQLRAQEGSHFGGHSARHAQQADSARGLVSII